MGQAITRATDLIFQARVYLLLDRSVFSKTSSHEMFRCRLARPERFELPTNWFEASYSIQLSYGRVETQVYRLFPPTDKVREQMFEPITVLPIVISLLKSAMSHRRLIYSLPLHVEKAVYPVLLCCGNALGWGFTPRPHVCRAHTPLFSRRKP
jgi:hypothetical protein